LSEINASSSFFFFFFSSFFARDQSHKSVRGRLFSKLRRNFYPDSISFIFSLSHILLVANSSINIVFYVLHNKLFQRHFFRMMAGCCLTRMVRSTTIYYYTKRNHWRETNVCGQWLGWDAGEDNHVWSSLRGRL